MSQTSVASDLRQSPFSIGSFFREAGTRETFESILVAIMLALLFKAFETEAFVIPTGSMAPTLQGLHKDVFCDQCGHEYRVSASSENPDAGSRRTITHTTCPLCRYTQGIDVAADANESSFSGDRIVVSKFAYDIAEPDRWEVVVFRYPLNAKQPYIKRLVGLPNEELRIMHGDIYVQPLDETAEISLVGNFKIVRKDHRKLLAMLQPVDDTQFVAPALIRAGWPSRWQEWNSPEASRSWRVITSNEASPKFETPATESVAWLRYRHLVPRRRDWKLIEAGQLPPRILDSQLGEAITDYYEYNDGFEVSPQGDGVVFRPDVPENDIEMARRGLHWVGDLAIEADVRVESQSGTLLFDLVEGGVHFICQFDLASGTATAWANQGALVSEPRYDSRITFDGMASEGTSAAARPLTAATPVRGAGDYHIRFANVDNRLFLWVNESEVEFDLPGTYVRSDRPIPTYQPNEPADAEPIGVGAHGAAVKVDRLRIHRDLYYISVATGLERDPRDYVSSEVRPIRRLLDDPQRWSTAEGTRIFNDRDQAPATFVLQEDQFFMMGDNSPYSSDARMWTQKFVHRKDLIGKAVFIFWPHSWWKPVPFWPRFSRMNFIR